MDTINSSNYTYSNLRELFRNNCHIQICVIVVICNDTLLSYNYFLL